MGLCVRRAWSGLRCACVCDWTHTRRRRPSYVDDKTQLVSTALSLPAPAVQLSSARRLRQLDAQYVIFAVSGDRRSPAAILNKRPANSAHSSARRRKILEQRAAGVTVGATHDDPSRQTRRL